MLAYRSAHVKQFLQIFKAWNVRQRRLFQNQNFEQKQHRIHTAQKVLTKFNDNPNLLKKVITGDESWVYGYDTERKAESFGFATIEKIKQREKDKSKQELLGMPKSLIQKSLEDW